METIEPLVQPKIRTEAQIARKRRSRQRYQANKRERQRKEGLRSLRDSLSYDTKKKVRRAASGRCFYCGERERFLTVDHRTPVARGGTNDMVNLVAACSKCNSAKGNLTDAEFFTARKAVGQEGKETLCPN